MMLQRRVAQILQSLSARCSSSDASNINDQVNLVLTNRNPRNLEKMRLAHKPRGYYLDKPDMKYWNKVTLVRGHRHITASIIHFINGTVVDACTSEWAINKQLFKTVDTCAYINLGRILAQRCLQAGITEVRCDLKGVEGGKIKKFLDNFQASGVSLVELPRYIHPNAWDRYRLVKPWDTVE